MIIIGEKINGTIPAVAEAIKAKNGEFIRELALRQRDAGADYLDVAAGTAPEKEAETLKWLVEIVENAVETPVCIDSPNADTLAAIIPAIGKPGIINSVSGEAKKCETLYPLAAKLGWKLIVLTCDDAGIPQNADRKVEIACSLIEEAAKHGIAEQNLYIDPLVLALSAVNDSLSGFTESIRKIRSKHQDVKFTLGLSNISYGMPARKYINRFFLAFALEASMDSAIMDPTSKEMYAALLAAEVLLGRDRHCRNYNKAFRAGRL
ncbi:MAG: dihydropteroate synthase [Treponema sp.]|jgi:5-methyltetrahydrofolate--homocysteine methyltransferase|nr:dihydropteroate synthase [Treponema sp.]